jgi:hypothetical protein
MKGGRNRMLAGAALLAALLGMTFEPDESGHADRTAGGVASKRVEARLPAGVEPAWRSMTDSGDERLRIGEMFADWAREAPTEAAESALGLAEDVRREALMAVMRIWGERDTAQAMAWAGVAVFNDAGEREAAMSMACTTAAQHDPKAAVEMAARYGVDAFANGVWAVLVAQWAEADLLSASAWVDAREPGVARDALVESVALMMAEADPAEAMRWALARSGADEGRERLVIALAEQVAGTDPVLARRWVELLPEAARERALGRIAGPRGAG